MSFLLQWIPSLAVAFILLIAAFVLDVRIRAERRRQPSHRESSDAQKGDGLTRV